MAAAFDRDALLDEFDQIGRAAVTAGTKLQIAVYGGSALLASNWSVSALGVRSGAAIDQPLVHNRGAVGRDAGIPDLRQSGRIRIAQYFHR